MTYLTRCDLCGAEAHGGVEKNGWATVTIYAPKIAPGKRGPMEQLDLCADCAGDLRRWVGERIARRG